MNTTTVMTEMTTIRVSKEVHKRLTKLGFYGDTMSEIISKCIDAYEKSGKK